METGIWLLSTEYAALTTDIISEDAKESLPKSIYIQHGRDYGRNMSTDQSLDHLGFRIIDCAPETVT